MNEKKDKKNFGGRLILRNGLITALSVITAILIAFFAAAVIDAEIRYETKKNNRAVGNSP